MSKVSVIVPVYNVEKYIGTCLESLMEQTLDDYKVIVINDGSPDNSQAIIDTFVEKYPGKIISIIKENGGYGSGLEVGIKICDSEYFLVCDPDDYLSDDALEHLYNLAKSNDCDLAIGAKNYIYEDSDEITYDLAYNKELVGFCDKEVLKSESHEFDKLFFVDPSPHSKLYKVELAKNIMFPHKIGYTDNILYFISLMNADRVIYTDKACAYYLVNRTGNTMTDFKPKVIDQHATVYTEIINQTNNCKHKYSIIYYRIFDGFKQTFRSLNRVEGSREEKIKKGKDLYVVVKSLIPFKESILKYMKVYSKDRVVERIKNNFILDNKMSEFVYDKWLKKDIKL